MSQVNKEEWDAFLLKHPDSHLLQTSRWGELKRFYGWEPKWLIVENSGAQVLFKRLLLGFHVAYIPKGPVGEFSRGLLEEIDKLCFSERAVFLKVEPDVWVDGEQPRTFLPGFRESEQTIQPARTILIDIRGDEDEILAAMKQKTRYNIRLSQRKGVVVRKSDDVKEFYDLMLLTGKRDRFGIHSLNYYEKAYSLFSDDGSCELFIAEHEGESLAGLMVFAKGKTTWYFYGASSNRKRNLMPTYALHWEAIKWAKTKGCEWYDLWGVPDEDEEVLEREFKTRNDGLWGVYRHKRGFGGVVKRSLGAWDRVYHPLLYWFYKLWVKRFRAA